MHGDDELRAQLFRESVDRRAPSEAIAALEQLRPSMRRARHRRIAAIVGASCSLVVGVGAVAQVVRTSGGDMVQTSSDEISDVEPERPLPGVDPSDGAVAPPSSDPSDYDEVLAPPTTDDDSSDNATGMTSVPSDDGGDHDDHSSSSGAIDGEPVATNPTSAAAATTTTAAATTTAAPSTTVSQSTGTPPSATSPSTTAVPTTTAAPSTTTVAPTTVPQEQTYSTACGTAHAWVGTDAVELIEVRPASGYTYQVEDPDHGSVTIKFSGTGEDCELTIRPSRPGSDDS